MKHKIHLRIVKAILAIAFVVTVWVGSLTIHQASAASPRQVGPTATATSTDTPTPTNTSTPTNTPTITPTPTNTSTPTNMPASWRRERGDRL